MKIYISLIGLLCLLSCNTKQHKITVSKSLLDSIKNVCDTNYTKRYRTDDFSKAVYFIKRKDSIVYQIMYNKDSSITQILGARKGIKILEQNFYNNGQLIATLQFDTIGKKTGVGIYYYQNAVIQRIGNFKDGFAVGNWKEFDEKGSLKNILNYDSNGVIIK
jgi:antitoxin component YwqK of YwqJK toxin-antitoxin module